MPSFLGHPRVNTVLLPPPVYATWNPAGTSGNITLSNWNLVADVTGPNTPNAYTLSASGGDSFDNGKRYFEIKIDSIGSTASSISVGFADSELDPSGNDIGDLPWGYAWRADGYREHSGNAVPLGVSANSGDVVMFAIHAYIASDIAKSDMWFGMNGNWFGSGDPASGLNPSFIGAIASVATDWGFRASLKTNGDRVVANFGGAAFLYPAPFGFSKGWGINVK